MKTSIFSLLIALMISGCGVGYESTPYSNKIYLYGQYGWLIQEEQTSYHYDQHVSETLYFETPYLTRGCKVYIDIYNDYNYAYVESSQMYLYDQWFIGSDEAHYVYDVHQSGYQYLWIDDLHPQSVLHINYSCY